HVINGELSACTAVQSRGPYFRPAAIVNHPWARLRLVQVLPVDIVGSNLNDHLLEDGVTERLEVLCDDHERAWAADHGVAVVLIEIRLARKDRKAVDGAVLGDRLIAGADHRTAAVIGTVA